MGLIYIIAHLVNYGVPLLFTLALAWALQRFAFGGALWGWPLGLVIAVALSCVPVAWQRAGIGADQRSYVLDTVLPDSLALKPGGLLHIEDFNHAGITCGYNCPLQDAGFVTSYLRGELGQIWGHRYDGSTYLGTVDLWQFAPDADRSQPFPYSCVFVSMPQYLLAEANTEHGPGRPDWPVSGKGVHMLLAVPPSGVVDFATAPVLYKRFNIQADVPRYGFWGRVTQTEQRPSVEDIMTDVIARTGG